MFSNLRQNSQIYIFHKGNNPQLEIGQVVNIPIVKPKYPQSFNTQQEMVVDLQVKINDVIVNYNSIPAQMDVADSFSDGKSIVISDSRDAMNTEVLNYKQKSIDIINSLDSHKQIVIICDEILNTLNPEYAEKKQQQSEINSLKEQMSEMSKNMTILMEANKKLIEQLTGKENKNEQNVGNK